MCNDTEFLSCLIGFPARMTGFSFPESITQCPMYLPNQEALALKFSTSFILHIMIYTKLRLHKSKGIDFTSDI